MCGLVGHWGDFAPELVDDMTLALAHRGPDGAGTFRAANGRLALGHRRLAILELSELGGQPMTSTDGARTVVFNGEIYNYPELRCELEARGATFRSHSDTEVLLHLHEHFGDDMLTRLDGMFAFALWDTHAGELLLARDRFGVKPLYYATVRDGFLFASELRALLRCAGVSRELDAVALEDYTRYLWCPAPRTPLKAVSKLPPGEAIRLRNGRVVQQWRYATVPTHLEPKFETEAEAVDAVTRALDEAVKRQLLADVPIGAFLSGGLDSSLLVALMKKHYGRVPIHTFTIDDALETSREGFAADLPYARRVAEHLGVKLHEIRAEVDIVRRLPEMIEALEEPQADLAPLLVGEISAAARARGLKVLLSGAGGDDLFAGYRRHQALRYENAWAWAPEPLRSLLRRSTQALPPNPPALRRLKKAFQDADRSATERLGGYYDWRPSRDSLLTADLRPSETTHAAFVRSLADLPAGATALERMLHLDRRHFLADHNLNYGDKMSMQHGVEIRVPFLDNALADVAARTTDAQKLQGGVTKAILKKAAEPYLPHDVIYRPKTGFGLPLRRWMQGELGTYLNDVLSDAAIRRRGVFDTDRLAKLKSDTMSGRADGAYTLLSALSIELWCRTFVDAPAVTTADSIRSVSANVHSATSNSSS